MIKFRKNEHWGMVSLTVKNLYEINQYVQQELHEVQQDHPKLDIDIVDIKQSSTIQDGEIAHYITVWYALT